MANAFPKLAEELKHAVDTRHSRHGSEALHRFERDRWREFLEGIRLATSTDRSRRRVGTRLCRTPTILMRRILEDRHTTAAPPPGAQDLRDFENLLEPLHMTGPTQRQKLVALPERSRKRGWWSEYGDAISESYSTFIGYGDHAKQFTSYDPIVVPGLLQVEPYARRIVADGIPRLGEREVDDRVKLRMRRQQVLTKPDPLRFSLILRESVLEQDVGGAATMRLQLEHLIETAELPNVTLRILLNRGAAPVGSFNHFVPIHLGGDEPDSVYIENYAGGRFEEDTNIAPYRGAFKLFSRLALEQTKSIDRSTQATIPPTDGRSICVDCLLAQEFP